MQGDAQMQIEPHELFHLIQFRFDYTCARTLGTRQGHFLKNNAQRTIAPSPNASLMAG